MRLLALILTALLLASSATAYDFVLPHVIKRLEMRLNTDQPAPGTSTAEPGCPQAGTVSVYIGGVDSGVTQSVTRTSVSGSTYSFGAPTEPAAGYCACKQKLGYYDVSLGDVTQEVQVWLICNFVNPLPTNMNGGVELIGTAFQPWITAGNPNGYVAYQQWLPVTSDVIIAGSFSTGYSITLSDLSYPDYGTTTGAYDYCGQYSSNTYWWACGFISKYPGRVQTTRTPWPSYSGSTTIAVLYPTLTAKELWVTTPVKAASGDSIALSGVGLGMSGLRVNLVCDPSMGCGSCSVAAGNTFGAATCTYSYLNDVGAVYAYALLPTAWNLPDLVNPPLALQVVVTCSITSSIISPVTLGTDTTTELVVNGAGFGSACSYGTCSQIDIEAQYGQFSDEFHHNVYISVISPTELRFKKKVTNTIGGNRLLNIVRRGLGSGIIAFPMKPTLTSASGAPFGSAPGSTISLTGVTLGVTFSPNCLSQPCSAPTCQYGTCTSSGVTFTGTTAAVTAANVRVISATSMELKLSSYAAVSGSNFDVSVSVDGYASAPITIGPFAPTALQLSVLPIVPLNNFPAVITIYGAGFEPSVTSVTLSQGACTPDVVVRDDANNRQYLKCNITSYPSSMADLKLMDLVAGGQSLTNPGAVSILHVGIGITDTEKTQLISRAVGTEISITGVGFGAACDYGSCPDTQISLVLGGAAGGSCPVATNLKIVSDTLLLCKVATPFYEIGVVTALFTRSSDTTNNGNVATVYPEVFGEPVTSIAFTPDFIGNFTVDGFGIGTSTWSAHKLKFTFSNGISCSIPEGYQTWSYNTTLCAMGGFPTSVGPFYLTVSAFGYWTGSPVLVGTVSPSPVVTPDTTLRMAWGTQAQITISGSNFPNNPHLVWTPESQVAENIVSSNSTQIVAYYAAPATALPALSVVVRGADGSVGSRAAPLTMCVRAFEIYTDEYNATLQCPNGGIISAFSFVDYGRPSGYCFNSAFPNGTFAVEPTCTTANGGAKIYAEQMCLGKNKCEIPVKNAVFSIEDPCWGFQKWLAVLYDCSYSCGGATTCQDGSAVRRLEASAEVVPWSAGYKLTLASPTLRFRVKFFYQMNSCYYRAVGSSGVISSRSCSDFVATFDSPNATLVGTISPALPAGTNYVEVQLADALDGSVTAWTTVADITAAPTITQASDTISGVASEINIHGTGFLSPDPSDYIVKVGPHDVPCTVTNVQPTLLNCTPEILDSLGSTSGVAVNASVQVYEVTVTGYIGILRVLDWSIVEVAYPSNFSKPGVNQLLSVAAINLPTNAPDFQLELRIVTSLGVNVAISYANEVITSISIQCEIGPFGYFGTLQASVKAYGYNSPWVTVGFIRNGPRVSGSFYGKIAASSPEITVSGASFPTNPHPTVDIFAGPTSVLLGIYPDGKISWQQAINFAEFTPISLNTTSKKRTYSYTSFSDTQVVVAISSWPAPLDTQRTDYWLGCRFNATVGTTIYEYYVDLGPIVPAATVSATSTVYASNTVGVSVTASGFDPRNSPYNRIVLISGSDRIECDSVTAISSTQLICVVPAGTNLTVGALSAELWSYGGPSNLANVGTIVAAATINPISVIPTWADDVPEFTITGTNFPSPSSPAGSATVTLFNSTTSICSSIVFVSTTEMICRAAAPFAPGPLVIVVTVFGGTTSEIQVANIVARPIITPSDASYPVNTVSLTIGGTGFDSVGGPSANKVYLSLPNSDPTCTISSITDTSIVCSTTGLSQTGTLTAIVTSFGGNSTQATVAIIEGGVSSNVLAGAVGGGVGGFIFLAALIALIVFLVLRQRKRKAIARADKFRRAASTASLEMQVVSNAGGSNSGETTFKQFDMSLVQFGKELGAGAFGKVYEGQLGSDTVAIKEAKITDPHARSEFFKEAELMLGMPPHENVVRTHGISYDASSGLCYIVMEMCYGSLDKLVFNENSHAQFKDDDMIRFARGIAAGMAHVAKNRIVHRDLASRNILLGRDGTPKISDFGMSRTIKETNQGQTASTVGPIQWMSPESMKLQYSEKSDVWMFGCLLYEIVAGEEPHKDRANDKLNLALSIRDTGLHPPIPEHAPQMIKDVMELCFAFNPAERPTFKLLSQILRGKISIKAAKEEIAEASQQVEPDTASPKGGNYENFQ